MADEKAAALSNALAQIERQFGKGSIMKMGEFSDKMSFDVISSGSIALDLALGVGGFPRGRIIEIYGPESSGKTTLALHVIAEAQKNGGTAGQVGAAMRALTSRGYHVTGKNSRSIAEFA